MSHFTEIDQPPTKVFAVYAGTEPALFLKENNGNWYRKPDWVCRKRNRTNQKHNQFLLIPSRWTKGFKFCCHPSGTI